MSGVHRLGSPRVLVTAMAVTMVSTFPAFLAGSMAVEMIPELDFDEASLGVAISGFFVVSAVGSMTLGSIADARGWAVAMRLSALVSAACAFATASFVDSWLKFAVVLSLGGLTMSIGNPAVNAALSLEVPAERRGFVFGLKHSAVPAAALLSGLALPLVALTAGWRVVYAGAGMIALAVALLVPRPSTAGHGNKPQVRPELADGAARPLMSMAVGAFFAASVASALSAFLVISAVDSGLSVASGGLLLALASVTGLCVRLAAGWWADARQAGGLGGVAVLLAAGAVGLLLLSTRTPWVLTVGAMLAFGAGWGWNGLFNFSIVKHFPESPARATSLALTGTYVGAAAGPLAMGALVSATSYPTAWTAASIFSAIAVFAVLAARWQLGKAHRDPVASGRAPASVKS